MKTLDELNQIIEESEIDDYFFAEYKQSFKSITKAESPETLQEFATEETIFYFAPLYVGSLFENRRFNEIYDFLKDFNLLGNDRCYDLFIGKLVKYFYLCLKYLNKPMGGMYKILAANKEHGNRYTIDVTTNAVLDYQINSHVYEVLEEEIDDKEERCIYFFNVGFIHLVRGEYRKALVFFKESEIINTSTKIDLLIKKGTIICKLHLGDSSIFYPYQVQLKPYFGLIGCIKRGDIKCFYQLLETYKVEYFTSNLYFVIRRLIKMIVQAGLKKIATCYSRIKLEDISEILGFNANALMFKTVKEEEIHGFIQDGIFYSQQENIQIFQCNDQLKMTIELRNYIRSRIQLPDPLPLIYENALVKKRYKRYNLGLTYAPYRHK